MSWLTQAIKGVTLGDLLAMLDPAVVENVAAAPEYARVEAYAAIDRIPARWGTWGKLLFTILVRWRLRQQVDRWIKQLTGG